MTCKSVEVRNLLVALANAVDESPCQLTGQAIGNALYGKLLSR